MNKLFEIPIYALSEKTLFERYQNYSDICEKKNPHTDSDTCKRCIEIETFPQRLWQHNHVIGYIDISFDRQEVVFDVFLPYPEVKRYDWRSKRKIHVRNIGANGTHFYIDSRMKNSDIQMKITDMLNRVIADHIPKKYYIDRTAFDMLHEHTDYRSIFDSIEINGDPS